MDVFINRTLNLKKIKFIGLDMDHTLIRYNSEKFEGLAYEKMKEKLVSLYSYPQEILDLKFDFKSVIRGLVIDKNRGNLLKVSRYGAVRESYHGLKPTAFKELKRQFGTQFIDLRDSNYNTVDTTFSISHACLFAQLVDLKDNQYKNEIPSYPEIAENLDTVLDLSHRDGSIKEVVVQNLDEYVIKEPEVVKNIEKYKKHNKHFFIVTNSDYNYTKTLLDYAINPFISDGSKWTDLFTWTITLANKPRFFYDAASILKINLKDGTMSNYYAGGLEPGVYQGGSANRLSNTWGVTGDEILYIGDHIYGDILRLKKDCEWRTGLVIEELKEEVELNKKAKGFLEEIQGLMQEKTKLEKELDSLVCKKIEDNVNIDESKAAALKDQIRHIDDKLSPLLNNQKSLYNTYWGEVMRVGIEESQFANQIERFADIYMPSLNDLLKESARSYFRSRRRQMAHDVLDTIAVE
ncbi:MAG: HAD-IG family 5'-nucleotidase [Bdellovibrionaceae bacterium]|nr:HAD-IG family 5'-nucleotidase [Pseudobdellovibrionaceae bacterium]